MFRRQKLWGARYIFVTLYRLGILFVCYMFVKNLGSMKAKKNHNRKADPNNINKAKKSEPVFLPIVIYHFIPSQ
jgi:hypothetical protein